MPVDTHSLTHQEPFEIKGHWWIDARSPQIGVLKVVATDRIRLEVHGRLRKSPMGAGFFMPTLRETIFGQADSGRLVSLHNCYAIEANSTSVVYNVGTVFINAHVRKLSTIRFGDLFASFTNLENWMNREPWGADRDENGNPRLFVLTPKQVQFRLQKPRITVSAEQDVHVSAKLYLNQEMTYRTFIRITPDKPLTFAEYGEIIWRFQQLFMLLSGEANSLRKHGGRLVKGGSKIDENSTPDVNDVEIYRTLTEETNTGKRMTFGDEMPFPLSELGDDFEHVMRRWFELTEKLRPVLNVLFGEIRTRSRFLEGRFFIFAQCLEALHRLAYGRRSLEFEKRLKRLFAMLEPETVDFIVKKGQLERFIGATVATRNQFAHLEDKKEVFPRHQWLPACEKLHALIVIHLLKLCGLEEKRIRNRMKHSKRFGRQQFEFAQPEENEG